MDAPSPSRLSRLRSGLEALPAQLPFVLPAFYGSDLRAPGNLIIEACILAAALHLLLRRPWPVLSGWQARLVLFGLALLALPALGAWSIAAEPLRATSQLRAWAAWLLLFGVAAAGRPVARAWLPLLWLPALAAILLYRGGLAPWWWSEGTPTAARLLLAPSLALALHGSLLSSRPWMTPPRVLLGIGTASYFLLFTTGPELFAFLAVYVFVSRHRAWSLPFALFFVAWWALATPQAWLDREEAAAPILARAHAQLLAKAPRLALSPLPSYGWETLATTAGTLPFGAGPGHEAPLLARRSTLSHPSALPGAFVWEGLCALGLGFFVVLAGFLLLQGAADMGASCPRAGPPARALLLGLWLLALFVPGSGFLSSPLWWMALGALLAAREAEARGYPPTTHRLAQGAVVVLILVAAVPALRQVGAQLSFPRPHDTQSITAADLDRIRRARAWEPRNGAYPFALAHARYDHNLSQQNLRFAAADEDVLALLAEAIAREPYNGIYRWVYSRFLLLAGRWDAALEEQRRAIALAPERLEFRKSMAETCENLGRLSLALEEYRACADLSPFDPELRIAIARVLLAQRRPAAAREEYRKVLRLAPDHPVATSYLQRHGEDDFPDVF